jgi:C-terminal processing protease CtpA/Prc
MPVPTEPVTLTREQIDSLNNQLAEMRHAVNNHLSLVAAAAGLRNGDVLLKIAERDVTKWPVNADSASAFDKLLDGPVGTPLALTVRRGDQVVKITVVVREIFGAKSI